MPNETKSKKKIFIIRRLGRSLFVVFLMETTRKKLWTDIGPLHIAHCTHCGEFLIFRMLYTLSFSFCPLFCHSLISISISCINLLPVGPNRPKILRRIFCNWALFLNNHTAHWRLFFLNINTK